MVYSRLHLRRLVYPGLTAGWLGLVTFGLWQMLAYSFDAAPSARVAEQWPLSAQVERSRTVPTVVLALHPYCSCSRATIDELAIVSAKCAGKLHAQVLLYRPVKSSASWSDTDLKASALRIPGVHVVDDPGGTEAARFQAATSGEISLFDISGRLLFHGGITASRGHAGDNVGRDSLISLLREDAGSQPRSTRIFGCSLRSPLSQEAERTP